MDFGRAFSHAQQDPDWLKKVGIAALVMLIPLLGPITVLGWGLEITRRVIVNDPNTLPDWSNFSEHMVRGFKGFAVSLAFSLPGLVLSICQTSITTILQNSSDQSSAVASMAGALGIVIMCISCLSMILSLAASFLMPAAFGNMMANNGDLGAAFRFNEVFGLLRAGIGPYLMAFLGGLLAGLIAGLGIIACIIGVLFTSAWAMTVSSHLYGQAYLAARSAQQGSTAM
jgi:hypothetical protein